MEKPETEISPKRQRNWQLYDAEVRAFLAEKTILAVILRECVSEFKNCTLQEIAEQYIIGSPQIHTVGVDKDTTNPTADSFRASQQGKVRAAANDDPSSTEGEVVYDIRFLAKAPGEEGCIELIINIEAQRKFHQSYPIVTRGIYYASRMISVQKSVEFLGSHYENIKKVYSIWVCYHVPEYRKNTIACYEIKERFLQRTEKTTEENPRHYDLANVILIGLGDPEKVSDSDTLRLLSIALSEKMSREKKKELLSKDFSNVVTDEMEERMEHMCDFGYGIWQDAYDEGEENGEKNGEMKHAKESARRLLDMGLAPEQIAKAVGFDIETVNQWLSEVVPA